MQPQQIIRLVPHDAQSHGQISAHQSPYMTSALGDLNNRLSLSSGSEVDTRNSKSIALTGPVSVHRPESEAAARSNFRTRAATRSDINRHRSPHWPYRPSGCFMASCSGLRPRPCSNCRALPPPKRGNNAFLRGWKAVAGLPRSRGALRRPLPCALHVCESAVA